MKQEQRTDFTIAIIGVIIGIILMATSCKGKTEIENHACKWEHCPYKGITKNQWSQAIKDYTECEEGSDCYLIDILHLQYPTDEYDQLDQKLFTNK